MFVVFLAFSFKTGGGEPNWPVTAYRASLDLQIEVGLHFHGLGRRLQRVFGVRRQIGAAAAEGDRIRHDAGRGPQLGRISIGVKGDAKITFRRLAQTSLSTNDDSLTL